jgi:hypothetical protein
LLGLKNMSFLNVALFNNIKLYTKNKSSNDMRNAKSPIASASPAPINAPFINFSSVPGFLDIPLISA